MKIENRERITGSQLESIKDLDFLHTIIASYEARLTFVESRNKTLTYFIYFLIALIVLNFVGIFL